ncbi:MAG: hypothetical protein E7620_07580 [Ruminococcaceae bacterium]|nr:hypothetical protein [Oscillospiraceae bacterium]
MRSVFCALLALLIAFLPLLTSCEGDVAPAETVASTEDGTVAVTEGQAATEEKTTTTHSGIIELPPVDV